MKATPSKRRRTRGRIDRRTLAFVVLPVIAAVVAGMVTQGPARAAVPAPPSGFTTIWSDDFTGAAGTGVNAGNWLYDNGTGYSGGAAHWGTDEVETMTSSTANVALDGAGHLAITPVRDYAGNWTSGRIETQRTDFAPPVGGVLRVEASIQQPDVTTATGAGYWPAFWMLGAAARPVGASNWPGIGEVDIMEDVNGRSSVWSTLHCGTASGGPCNETTGLGSGEHGCPGCQTAFHTYAVEYDRSVSPEQIRWYVDGKNFFALKQTAVDAKTWANAVQHGFFIILNVAIGGSFPAAFGSSTATSATASGKPMLVDYVSVATKGNPANPAPSPTTPSGPTTPADPPTPTDPTTPNTPTDPASSRNADSTLQAESFDSQSGTATQSTSDTGGGSDVGLLANGDWLGYQRVDFGSTPATQFTARVASGAAGGVSGLVEVRLDSRSNPPVGRFEIANTGGWQTWRSVPTNISAVTGVHDVYLTFTSGQPADFVNLNWFAFGH
jgi:beta-glucanase (GH16 family)